MNEFPFQIHFWNPRVTMDQQKLFSGDMKRVFGKKILFSKSFKVRICCPNKNVVCVCPSVCLSVRPNKFFSIDYEWIFNPNTFYDSSCNNGLAKIVLRGYKKGIW